MDRADLLERFREPIKVLDHGFVRLVDVMGDDARIEEVARLSYSRPPEDDTPEKILTKRRGLLRYLMRNRHTSPFEQATITLDIKLPIFVARQLVRHRTQSLNEVSGRYSVLPEEVYIPGREQICYQDANNRQGRAGKASIIDANDFTNRLTGLSKLAFEDYADAVDHGIAKETARLGLPLSTYTHWYTTWDAHNLLHMLGLRLDSHAQYEIRVFAQAIADIVKEWLPLTWEAFEDYRLHAVTLSRTEFEHIRPVMHSLPESTKTLILNSMASEGASSREIADFAKRFGMAP
ncbi:THY1 Predicted alternative thymidylate synthase [uncultured Caudovirales phage]|uniref:THY1 Predicted alternative thymidylate synthase n=1 Tax=uncultured Caudovirales phage TaxID=2100421 RepID=A0A6J5S4H2_9CAUD|nr:THY1 Predicted alternative thymidylate synthase [uncultured Caudovirales phage]